MKEQEIKKAVEVLKVIPRKPLGNKGQTNLYGIEYESLKVLLTLAQQVLDAKCPEEARPLPGSLSSPDSYIVGKRDGYNQALSDFRLYQAKCLEELEEVITNSSLSKALGDKYIKNHKGAEFGIFVWDKALSDLAQAIRDLFGGKEK